MSAPLEVFCCYAREDQKMLAHLKKHLALLERQGQITIWSDTNLNAGVEWEKELHQRLESADIILLLISPDFMASDYCYSTEMGRAIARHNEGSAVVIPILLRMTFWQNAPFAKLQMVPTNTKPITSWPDRDNALHDITIQINQVVSNLHTKRAQVVADEPTITLGQQTSDQKTSPAPRNPLAASVQVPPTVIPPLPPVGLVDSLPAEPARRPERLHLSRRQLIATSGIVLVGTSLTFLFRLTSFFSFGNAHSSSDPDTSALTTKTSAGHVLYQADRSYGWEGWNGGSEWKVSGGNLLCDGSGSYVDPGGITIIAPYQPTISNYAIEAQVRLAPVNDFQFPFFGLLVRLGPDLQGDLAAISIGNFQGEMSNSAYFNNSGPSSEGTPEASYIAGSGWHTYRVEVNNNIISFLVDEHNHLFSVKEVANQANGHVGLACTDCQLVVSSFKVMTL